MEVIVFTKNNARILHNPSDAQIEQLNPVYVKLIDPDKSEVAGLPPHYWVPDIQYNVVRAMPEHQRAERDRDLAENGADNLIYISKEIEELLAKTVTQEPKTSLTKTILKYGSGIGLGYLAYKLLA